jgi:hypothetical protein
MKLHGRKGGTQAWHWTDAFPVVTASQGKQGSAELAGNYSIAAYLCISDAVSTCAHASLHTYTESSSSSSSAGGST